MNEEDEEEIDILRIEIEKDQSSRYIVKNDQKTI